MMHKSLILCFLIIISDSFAASAKSIPDELRDFLLREIHLDKKEITHIEAGNSVSQSLKTDKREELAIFGIVHLNVTKEFFLLRFRNSLNMESSTGSLQNGIFSMPPKLSNLEELKWETDDLEKIRDCNPKNCTARLPGRNVTHFQKEVDWKSKNAFGQANALMRRLGTEYVTEYQNTGDAALTSYYSDGKLWSVKEGTHMLLKSSTYMAKHAPVLVSYLQNYPNEKNPEAENIFYWQKASFGLQPVIRFNHVVIWPIDSSKTIIASKMLFANHYFRDALELRSLISDIDSQGIYLLVLNRSHIDGMTGLKGRLVRGRAVSKSVEQLKQVLTKTKSSMEAKFRNDS